MSKIERDPRGVLIVPVAGWLHALRTTPVVGRAVRGLLVVQYSEGPAPAGELAGDRDVGGGGAFAALDERLDDRDDLGRRRPLTDAPGLGVDQPSIGVAVPPGGVHQRARRTSRPSTSHACPQTPATGWCARPGPADLPRGSSTRIGRGAGGIKPSPFFLQEHQLHRLLL